MGQRAKGQSQPTRLQASARRLLVSLLHLVFLPHETMMAFDAIIRSLVRRFITGERLLEWETAYQSELQRTRRTPIDRYLALMPLIVAGLGVIVWVGVGAARRHSLRCCRSWCCGRSPIPSPSGSTSRLASASPSRPATGNFCSSTRSASGVTSIEFGAERHNFLIPDNVEEDGLVEAARVSPTNIGLLLNARQAACELGFLTAPEFAALSRASLETIAAP